MMPAIPSSRRRQALARPYVVPSMAPYNPPEPISVPTYEGTGQTVHLDVVDFEVEIGGPWRGWRYWMAHTPYPNSSGAYENPSLIVSHDGIHWVTPPGLTNPLYWPLPGGDYGYNSDPDICYDPASDELVLLYRNNNFDYVLARSADGVTWPAAAQEIIWTPPGSVHVSPCLLRDGDGTWHLWHSAGHLTAPAAEGPWTPVDGYVAAAPSMWHMNVSHAPGGGYLGLSHINGTGAGNQRFMATTVSPSGVSVTAAEPVLVARDGQWDSELYRPALTLHENGTHVRVWYSGSTPYHVWRVGYTEIPLSAWPTI